MNGHRSWRAHRGGPAAAARSARSGLLTELVAGTLRMRGAVDYQLARRAPRGRSTALDAAVLTRFGMGAFQLLYLDRLPPSAVVNDAVALTKRGGKTSAAGLVNAVLRALSRDRGELTWPDVPPGDGPRARRSLASGAGWWSAGSAATASRRPRPGWASTIARRACAWRPTGCRSRARRWRARLADGGRRRPSPPMRAPHGLHVVERRAACARRLSRRAGSSCRTKPRS